MTCCPVILRDRISRIGDLIRNAIRLLREAVEVWIQTGQALWRAGGFTQQATAAGMFVIALMGLMCLAYLLLVILPLVILGALGVVLVRAVGRNL